MRGTPFGAIPTRFRPSCRSPPMDRITRSQFRAIWARCLLGTAFCLLSLPAVAQQDSIPIGAARPTATLTAPDSTVGVADVFIGRNTVGPYLLSWRGIETGSESVTRGGQILQRDADYK